MMALDLQVNNMTKSESEIEVERLTKHLHNQMNIVGYSGLLGHPDYEYTRVIIGRKTGENPEDKLKGDGWELNGEDHDSWTRLEYTEEFYYRRLKSSD